MSPACALDLRGEEVTTSLLRPAFADETLGTVSGEISDLGRFLAGTPTTSTTELIANVRAVGNEKQHICTFSYPRALNSYKYDSANHYAGMGKGDNVVV